MIYIEMSWDIFEHRYRLFVTFKKEDPENTKFMFEQQVADGLMFYGLLS